VLTIMIIPIRRQSAAALRRPGRARGGVDRARRDPVGDGQDGGRSQRSRRGGRRHLARARLSEAIAVTQVIGNFIPLQRSIFEPGDTLASRVANQYQGAISNIQISALIYLALILLVITFVANFTAQRIVKRFDVQRTGGG
jgi:hypothetical protein